MQRATSENNGVHLHSSELLFLANKIHYKKFFKEFVSPHNKHGKNTYVTPLNTSVAFLTMYIYTYSTDTITHRM